MGLNVIECLQQHASTGVMCLRFVRALMKLPSVMVSVIRGVTFSPNSTSNICAQLYSNVKGVTFRVYQGEERVNFKCDGCQSQFNHNGFIITSIVCNRTSKEILRGALVSIGVNCKILFKESRS